MRKSLEGTHPGAHVSWSFDEDLPTFRYDRRETNPESLARKIAGLGFRVEKSGSPAAPPGAAAQTPLPARVPEKAPALFSRAFREAQESGEPILSGSEFPGAGRAGD